VFELVREDLGLWVLELHDDVNQPEASHLDGVAKKLEHHRALLAALGKGSSDYTLHLSAEITAIIPLRIPSSLSRLASECGFAIEIYTASLDSR